eukprot:403336688
MLKEGQIIQLKEYTKSNNFENRLLIVKKQFNIIESQQEAVNKICQKSRPQTNLIANNPEDFNEKYLQTLNERISDQQEQVEQPLSKRQLQLLHSTNFVPFKQLNLQSQDWTIKAKILKKHEKKCWNNERGQGLLMNIDLIDQWGSTIQATFFKDGVEKFENLLQEGNVYIFTCGNVKTSNSKYTNMSSKYSLAFDKQALVKECETKEKFIPMGNLENIKSLPEIYKLERGQKCDVIVVIEQIGHTNFIPLKNGGLKQRSNLIVADDTGSCVLLCIWGREDIHFQDIDPRNPSVLYVRNAKISDFGRFSLNSNDESIIEVNPPNLQQKVRELQNWYRQIGFKQKLKNLTEMNEYVQNNFGFTRDLRLPFSTPNSVGGTLEYSSQQEVEQKIIICKARLKPEKFKLLSELIHYLNYQIPQAEYNKQSLDQCKYKYFILGYLSKIKINDQPYYKACPVEKCRKKMQITAKGLECRGCLKYYDTFVPAYSFSATISDHTDSIEVQFYRCHGEALLGCSAQKFVELKENSYYGDDNSLELQNIYNRRLYQNFTMEIQVLYTQPNQENKLSFNCMRLFGEETWSSQNKYILNQLKQYKDQYFSNFDLLDQNDMDNGMEYVYDEYKDIQSEISKIQAKYNQIKLEDEIQQQQRITSNIQQTKRENDFNYFY